MLQIQRLEFGYRQQPRLFTDLSLQLAAGAVVGLLGKNGSGKTSLLKLISGLRFPQAGSIDVWGYKPRKRQQAFLADIYILPEEFYVPALTPKEYVACYASFYPRFDRNIFNKIIEEFANPNNQKLTEMSHGQKKKCLLAFAIASGCRLVLLDEPTNGLDIPSKAQFRRLLASHVSEERCFIISTHQVHDVENLIDQVVLLDQGKIIFQQSMANIMQKLEFVRLQSELLPGDCVYSEKQLGSSLCVRPNKTHSETDVDLEVLFNAITQNNFAMQKIFE